MASIGDSFGALALLYVLAAIGGDTLYFLKHGFTIGRFACKGVMKSLEIPPLVTSKQIGMLWMGFLAGNAIRDVMSDLDKKWPPYIQNLALCIILVRSGLGLNIMNLRNLKAPVLTLSILPILCEWGIISVILKYTVDLPWDLSLAACFMLAAVSPAIMIPISLEFEKRGYGKEHNIPGLLIGVTALDSIFCIVSKRYAVFGILGAVAMSSLKGASTWFGDAVVTAGITVPLIVIGGLILGFFFGFALWLIRSCHWLLYLILLSVISLVAIYTTMNYKVSGLAYIAILVWSLISIRSRSTEDIKPISFIMMIAWRIAEVGLFALVGVALDVTKLDGTTVGYAVLIIFVGAVVKFVSSLLLSFIGPFSFKEQFMLALCRLPKATVQASLGAAIYTRADAADDEEYIAYGKDIRAIAAIAIMITSLLSLVIMTLAPHYLTTRTGEAPSSPVTLELERKGEHKPIESEGQAELMMPETNSNQLDNS